MGRPAFGVLSCVAPPTGMGLIGSSHAPRSQSAGLLCARARDCGNAPICGGNMLSGEGPIPGDIGKVWDEHSVIVSSGAVIQR